MSRCVECVRHDRLDCPHDGTVTLRIIAGPLGLPLVEAQS